MEEEEGPSNAHSTGPTGVSTCPMSCIPSSSNGLNGTTASAKGCLDPFGVPVRLGTLWSTLLSKNGSLIVISKNLKKIEIFWKGLNREALNRLEWRRSMPTTFSLCGFLQQ
jgi:hypothetical protein